MIVSIPDKQIHVMVQRASENKCPYCARTMQASAARQVTFRWESDPLADPVHFMAHMHCIVDADNGCHVGHGAGDADGPFDPDCACVGTPKQDACRKAGCGFCNAQWTRRGDVVTKPNHYVAKLNGREYEVADVCEAFDLNLRLGQVVQYILREKHKGGLEDLKKAKRWLGREIAKREGREGKWE